MPDSGVLQIAGLVIVLAVQIGSVGYASGVVRARLDGLAARISLVEQLLLPRKGT